MSEMYHFSFLLQSLLSPVVITAVSQQNVKAELNSFHKEFFDVDHKKGKEFLCSFIEKNKHNK